MQIITLLAAPLLASSAAPAAAQPVSAQPATPGHEQHQSIGKHQVMAAGQHCCCEQMMRDMHKMMSEMMQMHQGMAGHSGHDAAKDKPQEKPKL